MDLRFTIAVLAGKAAAVISRRLGRGGTALPGLVATRIASDLVSRLGLQVPRRVLVTGTNGKTTTSQIVASVLNAEGLTYLHNREGSNMVRGFASTLLQQTGPRGKLRHHDVGLFETDEATMPAAVGALAPNVIAFTNILRDQLDRYGEVDTVAQIWREALAEASPDSTLVLNADDPLVASLGSDWKGPTHYFGVDSPALVADVASPGDVRWCSRCGSPLSYEQRYFAHVGKWACSGCGNRRPALDTVVTDLETGLDESTFRIDGETLSIPIAGAYNIYNAAAATAIARVLGVAPGAIADGIERVEPAFGRQELVQLEGRRLRLLLGKNPAGTDQLLTFLASLDGKVTPLRVAVLLNDRFADSRDVSWIWDVNFEVLAARVGTCWAGGERAEDMALRLKYAGWPGATKVVRTPAALLDSLVSDCDEGTDVFVLPTYTAMLDLRAELVRRGAAQPYWERAQ